MMKQGRHVQLATCAVLLAALLGCAQHVSAQTADECAAASGVLIADTTGASPVCYPIFGWPWWNWGCSWHSCAPGFTCVPTSTWPFYTCVPLPVIRSPCCRKNQQWCASRVPPAWCKSQVWSSIADCTNPQFEFCTRRQIAKPTCVTVTCALYQQMGINPCPNKCYRCVDTRFGPKCVRICKWPCTWCPHGTFCLDHNLYGAICIPWPWWKWKAANPTRAVNVVDAPLTCAMLSCPPSVPCVMTDSGPQCGGTCAFDNCKVSNTAPTEPTALKAVVVPECNPGCNPGVVPRLEAPPANSCVMMAQACPAGTVCKEPDTAADSAQCVNFP